MGFHAPKKRYDINFSKYHYPLRASFAWRNEQLTIPSSKSNLPPVKEELAYKTPEQWKFLPGDKLMIVKGQKKGTVGMLISHDHLGNGYLLDNGATRKVVVPDARSKKEGFSSHAVDFPVSYTKDELKLVSQMVDEETGKEITFAANDVVFRGKYWDENHKKMLPYRCVKNKEHIVIPWPAPEEVKGTQLTTEKAKTIERTYFPTSVVHSGLPKDLKDSLRSPLAKRKVPRYAKQYITKSDMKRLTHPEMPEPEFKKLAREEKKSMAERAVKFNPQIEDFIGAKVAAHLRSIDNKYMKKYIEKVSGDRQKK